jgi:hypothetical protein
MKKMSDRNVPAHERKAIYDALVRLGVRHPRVEFLHPEGFPYAAWYYVEFNSSEYRFLGIDYEEAMDTIVDKAYEAGMEPLVDKHQQMLDMLKGDRENE